MKTIRITSAFIALLMIMPLFAVRAGAESDGAIYLSDLDTVSHVLIETAGITDGINQGLQRKKMSVGGREFKKGFCTHPVSGNDPSVITVDVSAYSAEYTLFHTVMGKDDITEAGGPGHNVVFRIEIDGKEAYMSDMVELGDVIELYLDVSGAKEIKLMCYAATVFAWLTADFGDTYLCKSGVKEIRLAKAPIKTEYREGERLSCSGGFIETEYENGAVVRTDIDASMVSGFDPDKTGQQQITVSFKDRTFTYTVLVAGNAPATEAATEAKTEAKTEPAPEEKTETGAQTEAPAKEEQPKSGGTRIIIAIAAAAAVAAVCAAIAVIKKRRGKDGRRI